MQSLALLLVGSRDAPAIARDALRQLPLTEGQRDVALVLVHELVANAVQHGEGEVYVRALSDARRVTVSVRDDGPGFSWTAPAGLPPPELGGWGLCLVDRLAAAWGIERAPTTVWFRVPRIGAWAGFAHSAHPNRDGSLGAGEEAEGRSSGRDGTWPEERPTLGCRGG